MSKKTRLAYQIFKLIPNAWLL